MIDVKVNILRCNTYFMCDLQFQRKVGESVSLIEKMDKIDFEIGDDYTKALANLNETKQMIEQSHNSLLELESLVLSNEDFRNRVLSVEPQLANKDFIQERQQDRFKLVQFCHIFYKKASDQYEEAQREYKNISDDIDLESIGADDDPGIPDNKRQKLNDADDRRLHPVSPSGLSACSPLSVDRVVMAGQQQDDSPVISGDPSVQKSPVKEYVDRKKFDVTIGVGDESNAQIGFNKLINTYKLEYANRPDDRRKSNILDNIINSVTSRGGRFLTPYKKGYVVMENKVTIRAKLSNMLRDKSP